MVNLRK